MFALYLLLAFVSYFTTGAADQSMIDEMRSGEFRNQAHEFANSCGSIGAFLASFFIRDCFGLSAFLIPAFLILAGLRLMRVYTSINLVKWFMSMMVLMIWASITFAKFLAPLFVDSHFHPGGDHGRYICQQIEGFVGSPGLTALLAVVAIAILTYISSETIYLIRKILNP
jgi:S-DNA-T family DNA segregation ATPase FtsK/SpoIIIE